MKSSRPSHLPHLPAYRAQLATLVDAAPEGDGWWHELKYDGYRIGCAIERGRVRLESRRGNDWTDKFPEVCSAALALPVNSALFDGEVAIVGEGGQTSFQALQNSFSRSRSGASRQGLTYFVFDLLHLDGRDLAALPLSERKAALEKLLKAAGAKSVFKYSTHVEGNGPLVLRRACELGAEGIVSKRKDQPYRPGRNEGWLKSKCIKRQEFVVGGFTEPEGARQGIGSLLIGYYDDRRRLTFAGKVGTGRGFTAAYTSKLRRDLDALAQAECPFAPPPPAAVAREAHWVRPERIAEVAFTEWTSGGSVRHGSLQGLREDKKPREVKREVPLPTQSSVASATRVAGVTLTTPERIVYPALALTKKDLAEYYAAVAERLLPYVAGRPLTLVRCDKGVRSEAAWRTECKFLRHEPGYHRWASPAIARVPIREQKKIGEYLVVDSLEGLIGLVQGDIVELHVWNSTLKNLEKPDRFVFDLDPGPDIHFRDVIRTARRLRDKLARVGLESWPKLTGGKGIHVVVPFTPELGWAEAYAVAELIARALVQDEPELLTLSFDKSKRSGKILIDYKRNHRAAVAVAAYSARARPGATVSLPLGWQELGRETAPDRHTIVSVSRRFARRSRDPWHDFWSCRQSLRAVQRR